MNRIRRSTAAVRAAMLAAAASTVIAVSEPAHAFLDTLLGGGAQTGAEDDRERVVADAQRFASGHEAWMQPLMQALYREGEWGAVRNLQTLGLAAMERGRFDLARRALDQAIPRIEAIYADDENARKARSLWNEEKVKDFKGEPYERSMAYYYRGILYLEEGDYQNARAAFLAADRHDMLGSHERYAADFGLMKYLAGWSSQCADDAARAEELLREAKGADKLLAELPDAPGRALVLIETGGAPVKFGAGQYKHILKFRGGRPGEDDVALAAPEGSGYARVATAADIGYQATTRGGRQVDGILAGKAEFKQTAGAIGDASIAIGTNMAMTGAAFGNRDMAGAGLIGLFAGIVAKGVEEATNPAADVRAWQSLPGKVLVALADQPNTDPLAMRWTGQEEGVPLVMQRRHGACSIGWGRTGSASSEAQGALGAGSGEVAEENRGDRNRRFRAMLFESFAPRALAAARPPADAPAPADTVSAATGPTTAAPQPAAADTPEADGTVR